jgi:hypothetical protein
MLKEWLCLSCGLREQRPLRRLALCGLYAAPTRCNEEDGYVAAGLIGELGPSRPSGRRACVRTLSVA